MATARRDCCSGCGGSGSRSGRSSRARLIGPSLSRLLTTCGLAGLVFGTCYLGVSVAGSLAVAALLVFVGHLGGGAQWTMSTFGLQLRAPDEVRGRILAADFAFLTFILTFTTTAAGALATQIGPQATMGIFAGISLTTGTAYLVVTRRLRHRLRAEEDSAAATAAAGGQLARTALTASTRLRARTSPFSVESMRFMA